MSRSSKISKKQRTDKDQKVMHIMFLYLDDKGLTEDFKKFSARIQDKGLSKNKYTTWEVFKINCREIWSKIWGD